MVYVLFAKVWARPERRAVAVCAEEEKGGGGEDAEKFDIIMTSTSTSTCRTVFNMEKHT